MADERGLRDTVSEICVSFYAQCAQLPATLLDGGGRGQVGSEVVGQVYHLEQQFTNVESGGTFRAELSYGRYPRTPSDTGILYRELTIRIIQ